MKKIQKAYERIQKAKRRLKHEHSLANLGMYFCWSIERLQRTLQRRVLQRWLMRRLLRMRLICLMHGRRGEWRTSIFSLLGQHSKRLLARKEVGH